MYTALEHTKTQLFTSLTVKLIINAFIISFTVNDVNMIGKSIFSIVLSGQTSSQRSAKHTRGRLSQHLLAFERPTLICSFIIQ